jgi:hypothetical protein
MGKKIDYTSIPYSKIQTFSVETAGVLDRDCELEVYISSIGKIRFEIRGGFDIVAFNRIISKYVLEWFANGRVAYSFSVECR